MLAVKGNLEKNMRLTYKENALFYNKLDTLRRISKSPISLSCQPCHEV